MELRAGISLAAIEQWGYQTVHGTNPVTYDLPIPFEEAPFTVAISTGNSGNHASCGGFTKTTIVLRAGTTAGVWDTVGFFIIGCQLQWGFSVTLSFESQLYYQHYPISFTVGPFTNILTTVSDEVNGVVYAPTTVNWYKDKFGIVCDYYSNGAYVKPTSVTFISLGI